jgi:hypothetical protein
MSLSNDEYCGMRETPLLPKIWSSKTAWPQRSTGAHSNGVLVLPEIFPVFHSRIRRNLRNGLVLVRYFRVCLPITTCAIPSADINVK